VGESRQHLVGDVQADRPLDQGSPVGWSQPGAGHQALETGTAPGLGEQGAAQQVDGHSQAPGSGAFQGAHHRFDGFQRLALGQGRNLGLTQGEIGCVGHDRLGLDRLVPAQPPQRLQAPGTGSHQRPHHLATDSCRRHPVSVKLAGHGVHQVQVDLHGRFSVLGPPETSQSASMHDVHVRQGQQVFHRIVLRSRS